MTEAGAERAAAVAVLANGLAFSRAALAPAAAAHRRTGQPSEAQLDLVDRCAALNPQHRVVG